MEEYCLINWPPPFCNISFRDTEYQSESFVVIVVVVSASYAEGVCTGTHLFHTQPFSDIAEERALLFEKAPIAIRVPSLRDKFGSIPFELRIDCPENRFKRQIPPEQLPSSGLGYLLAREAVPIGHLHILFCIEQVNVDER